MNHPETYEKFVVPEGETKVKYTADTKVANAATFEIQREDHTVGDPLVMQLLEDPAVAFAAYKIPHPLEHRLQIKVKTSSNATTPAGVYNAAIDSLKSEIKSIKEQFQDRVREQCQDVDFEPHQNYEQPLPGEAAGFNRFGDAYDVEDEMGFD